jgi:hypothetical protein
MYNYVYKITNKETGKMYIGTRSSKDLPKNDLGSKYFSSSFDKDFILEQKQKPHLFDYNILYTFDTRLEAIEYEIYLHSFYDIARNPLFYNRSKQTSTRFDTTGTNFKNSEITKIKKSEATKKAYEEGRKNVDGKNNPMFGNGYKLKGAKNGRALKIHIFDNKNNLKYESDGNFEEICKKYNLPLFALSYSYKNNKPIYSNQKYLSRIKEDWRQYSNWYAKVINN